MSTKDEIDSQFLNWDYEMHHNAKRSAKVAWAVAGGMFLIALAAVLAVAALTPLKTVEAVYVRVDASTGIIDVLHTLDEVNISPDEAVSKYFVAKYVRARNRYLYGMFSADSAAVLTMSDGAAKRSYQTAIDPENPASPYNQHGHKGRVDIDIKSISFIREGVASVRFTRTVRRNYSEAVASQHIATVIFTYVKNAEITFEALMIDPLGFVVTEWRDDEEILR